MPDVVAGVQTSGDDHSEIVHNPIKHARAPVAQLDRVSVFGTEGCRFEPCRAYLEIRFPQGFKECGERWSECGGTAALLPIYSPVSRAPCFLQSLVAYSALAAIGLIPQH